MGEGIPILLAATGGATVALAAAELAAELPLLRRYLEGALTALGRAGADGTAPSALEQRRLGVLAGLALAGLALLVWGPGPPALLAVCGPAGAGWLVSRRRRGYRGRLESQIPAIAGGLADALAAGGSLRTALADLSASLEGPAGIELARIRADLGVGVPPREALRAMAARSGSERVARLVGAVLSQQQAGGDLAALLRSHAEAAVQRQRAEAEARSATAQARLTGGMVVAMPLAVAVLVELASPGFVASTLADPIALILLALSGALQLGGYLLIQRLGTFEGRRR